LAQILAHAQNPNQAHSFAQKLMARSKLYQFFHKTTLYKFAEIHSGRRIV